MLPLQPQRQRHAARRRRLPPAHRRTRKGGRAGACSRRRTRKLREKIDDKLWSIREENTEFVTRAMEAGAALTRIFEAAVASGAISIDDMFDTDYVEIPGTNPLQHRTQDFSIGPTARCRRSRKPSWPRTRAWCSAS